MSVVQKSVLDGIAKNIDDVIDDLEKAVLNYIDASEKIDTVITVLKEHYNSEGGEVFTNSIAKADFIGGSLEKVTSSAKNVNYAYNVNKGVRC